MRALYDEMNRPQAQIDARGNTTMFSYDLVGNRRTVENALGDRTTTSYNSLNLISSIEDPLGYLTTYGYDKAQRPTSVTNARGYTTTTAYDAAGRVEATEDPLGYRTTFGYDKVGQRISTKNARGYLTTSQYDPVGNLTHIENPLGNITTYTYDELNRRTNTKPPRGPTVSISYDPAGRVISTGKSAAFGAYLTTFSYDKAGRRIEVLDAEGNRTTTLYDDAGRIQVIENALGHRTTLAYDPAGRREALLDANGHATTFSYDDVGNVTEEVDSLGRLTTYTYSPLNQIETKLDARNVLTTFSYDPVGRQTLRQFSDGTASVTLMYDAVGNRETMQDSGGQTTYSYDPLNRPKTVQSPWAAPITYSYDPVGNRATMIDPDGGSFTYSYDRANQLSYLDNPFAERTTFTYDSAGRETSVVKANNVKTANTYDPAGQWESITYYQGAADFAVHAYTYDKVGNVKTREDVVGSDFVEYKYDATYRLINERHTGAATYNITHTYDPVGNRLFEDADGQRTTFTYDAANQLATQVTPSTTTDYDYDGAGNLSTADPVGSSATDYGWNAENQLTSIFNPVLEELGFLYNGDGLRTTYIEGESPSLRYLWDANNLLMEKNIAGATQLLYTYDPQLYGKLISHRWGSSGFFHLFDTLRSTLWVTDSAMAIKNSYVYKAYGATAAQTVTTLNRFKWLGQVGYYDGPSGGMHYVRARYYNPALARWMSQDPLFESVISSWRANKQLDMSEFDNLYCYVNNRPLLVTDPAGLVAVGPILVKCASDPACRAVLACIVGAGLGVLLEAILSGRNVTIDELICALLIGCFALGCSFAPVPINPIVRTGLCFYVSVL